MIPCPGQAESIRIEHVEMAEVPGCCCETQRLQLRDLLDEWGERHTKVLIAALKEAMVSQGAGARDGTMSPTISKMPTLRTKPAWTSAESNGERNSLSSQEYHSQRSSLPWQNKSVMENVVGGFKLNRAVSGDLDRECHCQEMAARIVNHQMFGVVSAAAIVANAVCIGYQTNQSMIAGHREEEDSSQAGPSFLELGFSLYFAIEVTLRWLAAGWMAYLRGKERGWNIFDLALVIHGLVDLCLGWGTQNASYLRIMRLFRMLKLLRVIRLLRGMRELRFILNSILGSVRSTIWSLMLVFAVTYIFGTIFLQAFARYVHSGNPSTKERACIMLYWGSLPQSMLSLLMASTGGQDWEDIGEPVWIIGWPYYTLFVVYLVLFLFVVVNTVCGLFVEATLNRSYRDEALLIQSQLDAKDHYVTKLQQVFKEFDVDKNGLISNTEFQNALCDPKMQAFLGGLHIDASDAESFFRMLTEHTVEKEVDLETFVVGCIKLRGEAKAMDLFLVQSQATQIQKQLDKVQTLLMGGRRDLSTVRSEPKEYDEASRQPLSTVRSEPKDVDAVMLTDVMLTPAEASRPVSTVQKELSL